MIIDPNLIGRTVKFQPIAPPITIIGRIISVHVGPTDNELYFTIQSELGFICRSAQSFGLVDVDK